MPHKMAALNFFGEITQKSSFNIQYSYRLSLRSEIICGNWKPLKNHEKYFLFHLHKLNMLLANQILQILCIFIQLNVWYLWSLKKLATKSWLVSVHFRKYFTGSSFCGGWTKKIKPLADISFESSLQNTVLPSLLLFFCVCY